MTGGVLRPDEIIRIDDDAVVYLDQTLLPGSVVHARATHWQEVADAIRRLAVRGAPLIGIAGAMGVALAARAPGELPTAIAELRRARPTAVNLAWAVDRMSALIAAGESDPRALAAEARRIHLEEVTRCEAIGRHGASLIGRGARILTHCNAGALATGGHGTALGIVRAAVLADPTVRVVVDETRPLLQGARLTAWELQRDGIGVTLITDSMAATMMATGRVTHVVVGADRIAANGDVANKIGTYGLAVLAREHGLPMIVAAPTTTVDPGTPTGAAIPIEERAAAEVTGISLDGRPAEVAGVSVANPAFDVTPARLVSAIVTEDGVLRPPYDRTLAGGRLER